jgi:hypothetical protein
MDDIKPCWKAAGLTLEGARRAELAIPLIIEALRILSGRSYSTNPAHQTRSGEGLVRIVVDEAVYRIFVLPSRTQEYQRHYGRENRFCLSCGRIGHTYEEHLASDERAP